MRFTDLFIKRPVLATVVSLLIFFVGLRAFGDLPLREFPKVENTVITITTTYPGANSRTIQGFITSPIEKSIASADGIDYITAESKDSVSTISAHIKLNYNPSKAFTDIMSKVAEVRNQLPQGAQEPIIAKNTGASIALMYLSFSSDTMTPEQITDYISRVVQPELETVAGVSQAQILGGNTFAMRVWLNPKKMAAFKVTPTDVSQALRTKNVLSAAGNTKGNYTTYSIKATSSLQNEKQFKNIIIRNQDGALVKLSDVATVKLGSQDYNSSVSFNGKKAIFIAISTTPAANPLTVIDKVKSVLPKLANNYPPGLSGKVVYDATTYIKASIHEVIKTIAEATLIVLIVIFLFLGSFRSVIIPVITIPLSLVGAFSFMLAMGYSINLLTLLAMVLAIGMVVDDAIVVVENIHRHIEEGMAPYDAAIKGAREIALPVVSMTLTLVAVYAPIGFMSGLTGALFKEFAFTLAGSVVISGIIALTLSPMMCSKLLKQSSNDSKFVKYIDRQSDRLKNSYDAALRSALDHRKIMLIIAGIVLVSCYFLFVNSKQELAPVEDQSVIFVSATAPQYADIDYVEYYSKELNEIYDSFPAKEDDFIVNGMGAVNNIISGFIMKPWGDRDISQQQIIRPLQKKLAQIPGLKAVAFPLPSLPTGDNGLPLQFVITTTADYKLLYEAAMEIQKKAMNSGYFIFLDSDLKFNKPQLTLTIDRDKAALMGISSNEIANALSTSLSENYTNRFNINGRSYQVIPQLLQQYRADPSQLNQIYLRTNDRMMVPLSTFVSISQSTEPNKLASFQQLNSITIQGMVSPAYTLADGLNFLTKTAQSVLPKNISYDYAGQSRQFVQEGSALMYTFFFAILVIFLVLAAQFESFRDPLIVLISVPMSICGALIPINLGIGEASINIYTQVGLITLIGLITKHGILMVEFANQIQREEGLSKREAIQKAAAIRLRPILMTTASMVFGVVPLLLAAGAGAVSRFNIGLVISSGMVIGTIFTLFMVPTIYIYLAKDHKAQTNI